MCVCVLTHLGGLVLLSTLFTSREVTELPNVQWKHSAFDGAGGGVAKLAEKEKSGKTEPS